LNLRESALRNDRADPIGKFSFGKNLWCIRDTEIFEDIPGALLDFSISRFVRHNVSRLT
jgi:hypothetical protein